MPAQARARLDRARELEGQARDADALVVYAEVVERFGAPLSGPLRDEVVRAAAGVKLDGVEGELGTAVTNQAAEGRRQFGPADVETGQVVAWALVCLGLTLERLDRPQAALLAYDELAVRFDGTEHALTLVRVAWAMYDKALVLFRLERAEEAIAAFDAVISKFADVTDDRVRPRVSWSLWKKSGLLEQVGRGAEVLAHYERLVARHDEVIDPELGDIVAWCMHAIAGQLRAAGKVQDELRVYDDLIERFGHSDDEPMRLRLAEALAMKAYSLGMAGEQAQSIAVYDEMDRFRDADQAAIQDLLADSLCRKARALETLGRINDAVAAVDDSLVLLADSRDSQLVRRRMDCLLDKATLLDRAYRESEAIIVFDGVVFAYDDLPVEDRDDHARGKVALALLEKAMAFAAVDSARSSEVVVQLADFLGDVTVPPTAPPRPRREPVSETEIAALLAELFHGDCWMEFATSGDDAPSLAAMESKALELYRRTAGWLGAEAGAWDTPAFGAVTLIRHIADGYALLARRWSKPWRAKLSLPSSLLLEFVAQRFGIAEWAEGHGHPLHVSDSTDLAEELIQGQHERTESWDLDLGSAFLASVRHYEMLAVLCDSPSGRAALHIPELKRFAIGRINDARQFAGWAWQQQEEAAGVAAARIFIAQAYFVATHDIVPTSNEIFPSRETLREMLGQTDAYAWLENQDVHLPEWLAPALDD